MTAQSSSINRQNTSRIGLVTVFTGDGKGKTTAAIGTAVRALGYDYKVCVLFFLKGTMFSSGEIVSLNKHKNIEMHCFGTNKWVKIGQDKTDAAKQAREALKSSVKAIQSGLFDLVVLDEINCATDFGLISVQEVLDLLKSRPPSVDVILTGRNADKRLIDAADVVTEMKCIKHAYERGIEARQGIDY